jgi:hypothetical protein
MSVATEFVLKVIDTNARSTRFVMFLFSNKTVKLCNTVIVRACARVCVCKVNGHNTATTFRT